MRRGPPRVERAPAWLACEAPGAQGQRADRRSPKPEVPGSSPGCPAASPALGVLFPSPLCDRQPGGISQLLDRRALLDVGIRAGLERMWAHPVGRESGEDDDRRVWIVPPDRGDCLEPV